MANNFANTINSTIGASNSGATNTFTITNPSNTASSAARETITVGGATSDDPSLNFNVSGVTNWEMGCDNSDSDAFAISASAALGTTNVMRISTAGEINLPLQPAFLAYLGTTDSNCTGDNTNFVVGSGNALTEVFDQNGDFVTTGTFTSPVLGRYFLQGSWFITGGTAIVGNNFLINTSNRNYRQDSAGQVANKQTQTQSYSVLADMDAADTATISVIASDTGGKVDDLFGFSTPFTWFSGYLAC